MPPRQVKQAAFVVAPAYGLWAATTRPSGGIGLPGGKVEPGETPKAAARREAREKGWKVTGLRDKPAHVAMVGAFEVFWFFAEHAVLIANYKERGRIIPITASLKELAESGHGNEWLFAILNRDRRD